MAEPHANTKHILPPDADILACLNQGWTVKKIAEHFGVGYESVMRRIQNYGLRLQMDKPEPTPQPARREGIVIDRRTSYVLGRNEFSEIEITLPALSILKGCKRYERAV